MSPIEQVLTAAKKINEQGREPTLALIKTKLGNSIPMRELIQGLQQFKSMSAEDRQAIPSSLATAKETQDGQTSLSQSEQADRILQLESALNELRNEFKALKSQFDNLQQSHMNKEPDTKCM
ncbi:hypothetical protein MSG37_19510 [Shewanella sp. 1CM18E]|uniref:DNA-binding protein n=1 Tax=Shewanella sp. 1CM18E TaxID=2929169 RepID=UPI0020C0C617|nr:hypothetical protein [Shewanella sp. 1CM18E]MCK8047078.1 hypothetical protein [Shewanella sp. 1CM18E]